MAARFSSGPPILDKLLVALGLLIVVTEFYLSSFPPMDGLIVALGVLLIYIGSWQYVGGFIRRRSNTVLGERAGRVPATGSAAVRAP